MKGRAGAAHQEVAGGNIYLYDKRAHVGWKYKLSNAILHIGGFLDGNKCCYSEWSFCN